MKELQSVFGADRVENALAGTPLADLGRKHNFGLYVVRKAITDEAAKTWMVQSTSLDPEDLFVDFLYTAGKSTVGIMLSFLDGRSLGRIEKTSMCVYDRLHLHMEMTQQPGQYTCTHRS